MDDLIDHTVLDIDLAGQGGRDLEQEVTDITFKRDYGRRHGDAVQLHKPGTRGIDKRP